MTIVDEKTLELLNSCGQQHLLEILPDLSDAQAAALLQAVRSADLPALLQAWQLAAADAEDSGDKVRAERAAAPNNVVRQPGNDAEAAAWQEAEQVGANAISNGLAAVITVAGGQGTRLGFDLPKGMFPIGPASSRTLFQIFAEQILARRRRHNAQIPWLIMTSAATHQPTVEFFAAEKHFGLDPQSIHFFQQGSLPALDAASGQILFTSRGTPALSPDGHGGLLRALRQSGLLQQLADAGIRHLYYHQVDNPTVVVADPALIGFHQQQRSQLTTMVVSKTSPEERMGVLADLDGRTEIIEYSELTAEQAARTDAAGDWIFWAGNIAVHVFCLEFLQQLTAGDRDLPLHAARKKVPCVDRHGNPLPCEIDGQPNAVKLERFIFDALPAAERTLIVEGDRERQFNPVKNATGSDSAETSRQALSRIAREWLMLAGCSVDESDLVEISPLQALDAGELSARVAAGEVHPEDLIFR